MAEQYQPVSINTGSAQQAIQSTPNATPALDGLMQGIRDGFISADDIRKRIQGGPLEAATRAQDMADVTQVRPLQRQAVSAQLQNVAAAEEFEASTLPILNATKRAVLEQAHQNALQFGAPEEILKIFYASVPNFIPYDPDKLHDKKTGQVNIPYANEKIIEARQAAAKMAEAKANPPAKVSSTNVSATGAKESFDQLVDLRTGQPMGPKVPTGVTEASPSTNTKEAKSSRLNEFTGQEEDIVQRYDSVTGALIGEPIVIGTHPVKLTQEQANALQFSSRMDLNNQVIEDLEKQGFDPTALKTTAQKFLFNRWQPDALQAYQAAQRNWVTAALRKESGAAINAGEYKRANQEYFPQDGDSPALVKQKQALRELAEENLRISAAGAGGALLRPSGGGGGGNFAAPPGAAAVVPPVPAAGSIPTVSTVEQARALPPDVHWFRDPTGQTRVNPNWRGPVAP